MPSRRSVEYLLSRYEPDTNGGCWLWVGAQRGFGHGHGHGHIFRDGRFTGAHRFFYENLVGPIPAGLQIRHACDVPACVNPAHLSVGTGKDNAQDCIARGRRHKNGGVNNPNSRLTEADVAAIRADPRTAQKIALDYGMHFESIRNIRRRGSYV